MSAPGLRTHSRVVGVTALALATSWIVQNLVVAVVVPGAPTYADPISEVAAFHASHRGSIALLVGLEALNLPLLLGFLTGLRSLVGARPDLGRGRAAGEPDDASRGAERAAARSHWREVD